MLKFNMAMDDTGEGTITLVLDGEVRAIDQSHPNFTRITDALVKGEDQETIEALLSIEAAVTRIDDRVSIINDVLHFDGNPVHNNLTNTILRYTREGRDAKNLVRFMERLEANPSRRSREQLFHWTKSVDLTIDEDGYIVGYKGVHERPTDEDYLDALGDPIFPIEIYPYRSGGTGHAFVDELEVNGQTPVGVGAVVTMPREEVQDDPNQGCSFGLHVGSYDYAKNFAPILLEVRFDPADVVSVPADCSFTKLRCCRYEVVDVHEPEVEDDLSRYEPEAEWDDDEVFETLAPVVPASFLEKFKARFKRGGN